MRLRSVRDGNLARTGDFCAVESCKLHPVRPLAENAVVLLDGDFGHHHGTYRTNLRRRVLKAGQS